MGSCYVLIFVFNQVQYLCCDMSCILELGQCTIYEMK